MTEQQQQELLEEQQLILAIQEMLQAQTQPRQIEYRVYYNEQGQIITYTTEDIPGDYLVITADQYQQARHDAMVVERELVYTHVRRHVTKLTRNLSEGTRCSKYDISVLVDEDQEHRYLRRVLLPARPAEGRCQA